MKKIKLYLCIITGILSFSWLIFTIEPSSSLLSAFIYIVLLSITYLLAHSIKKDKQLSNMHKPKIKKNSFVYKIITFIRKLLGILCAIMAVSLFSTLFVDTREISLTICVCYTFALFTFVLLKKRTPESPAIPYTEPAASSAPETEKAEANTFDNVIHAETTEPSAPEIEEAEIEEAKTDTFDNTVYTEPVETSTPETEEAGTDTFDNVIYTELTEPLSLDHPNRINASGQAMNRKVPSSSPYPPEVLASMRTAYSRSQIDNDIHILNDCINIMNSTSNLETFFSRYETAMQTAFTLQMARDAGIIVNTDITPSYISSLKDRADNVLEAVYAKELKEIQALKTPTGKRNRIDKFLNLLSEYFDEFEFSDVYNNIVDELNTLKQTT